MNANEKSVLRPPPWLLEQVRQLKRGERGRPSDTTGKILLQHRVNTVCHSARCPNLRHCFSLGTATFMILGKNCSRNCSFCAVTTGRPEKLDEEEPIRIRESVRDMALTHVVITSVTRDDLPDGGACHFAAVIRALQTLSPAVSIEVLLPDFQGSIPALQFVLDARPNIVAHNIETVQNLYPAVRPAADYHRSLQFLSYAARNGEKEIFVKSGFMVGLGEKDEEILELMRDLRESGVSLLTIGQYLAPSLRHYAVRRFVATEYFTYLEDVARRMGFIHVVAGPLVRSSYHADTSYKEAVAHAPSMAAY